MKGPVERPVFSFVMSVSSDLRPELCSAVFESCRVYCLAFSLNAQGAASVCLWQERGLAAAVGRLEQSTHRVTEQLWLVVHLGVARAAQNLPPNHHHQIALLRLICPQGTLQTVVCDVRLVLVLLGYLFVPWL